MQPTVYQCHNIIYVYVLKQSRIYTLIWVCSCVLVNMHIFHLLCTRTITHSYKYIYTVYTVCMDVWFSFSTRNICRKYRRHEENAWAVKRLRQ